eukprot:3681531-Rhodomonas_salina.1
MSCRLGLRRLTGLPVRAAVTDDQGRRCASEGVWEASEAGHGWSRKGAGVHALQRHVRREIKSSVQAWPSGWPASGEEQMLHLRGHDWCSIERLSQLHST